jgi:hypothetical protein
MMSVESDIQRIEGPEKTKRQAVSPQGAVFTPYQHIPQPDEPLTEKGEAVRPQNVLGLRPVMLWIVVTGLVVILAGGIGGGIGGALAATRKCDNSNIAADSLSM